MSYQPVMSLIISYVQALNSKKIISCPTDPTVKVCLCLLIRISDMTKVFVFVCVNSMCR